MTDYCRTVGPALVRNGYRVVPIRGGEKRPAISEWQKAVVTSADLARFDDHGVGVVCGQGSHPVVGVDIDVSHPVIGPALVAWCHAHLGQTVERVGAAPRVLLAYRAAEAGWTKGRSIKFFDRLDSLKPNGKANEQQIELLGFGQQFVAYHTHPDTHQPYVWTDVLGGLEHVAAADLPVVQSRQLDALLVEVARLVRTTPGVEVRADAESPHFDANGSAEDDLLSLVARVGMSISEIRAKLQFLRNLDADYDYWIKVGAALHHEFAGTEYELDALAMWREFGAKSKKDRPSEYDYKWRSFGKHHGAPTTLRWLIKECNTCMLEQQLDERREQLGKVKALIEAQDDSLVLGSPAVLRQIKELMPADDLLRRQVVSTYQQHYKVLSRTTLPVTEIRALLLGPKKQTVHSKRSLTEFGNAERLLDKFGAGLMYVPEIDGWYMWTGVYWRRAVRVEIEHLAKETIRALVNEADQHEDQGEFFAFCTVSQQARMVTNMVRLASSDPRVVVPARELDRHTHLLGVRNGVVDLRTGALLTPDPEYRITLVTATVYDPTATCPLFERVVREVFFDDKETVRYFLRCLGYSLMGNPREEVLLIPFGNGANGKSTLLNTVRDTLGDYARSAEASSFIAGDAKMTNAGGPREDLVRLRGSRFVYVNEPDESGELREGAVKSMTGGDAISARGMHAPHSVEMVPTWVVWMPTNHKPIVKGGDNGIWRRLVLIPFQRNFAADATVPQDRHLKDKLLQEKTGVLSLLVRAAVEYQRVGLAPPTVVTEARDEYRKDMDLLAEWLEECCDVGPCYRSSMTELWRSWEMFAKQRGNLNYVKSAIALGRRLDGRFVREKGSRGTRLRIGLAPKGQFGEESVAGVAG